jgi:hypothetical protein
MAEDYPFVEARDLFQAKMRSHFLRKAISKTYSGIIMKLKGAIALPPQGNTQPHILA